ncbi:MAG: hypothetical protein ACHQRM_03025 [Bacteroidia bacterium]
MKNNPIFILKRVRTLTLVFIILLVLSGVTAFPLQWELSLAEGHEALFPNALAILYKKVHQGIVETNIHYPFLSYGTDWLAFSHIIIALFFIPVIQAPLRYLGNLEMGIIACILVFPLAFICGSLRQIPFFWQLIDCSFGFFGGLLLYSIRKNVITLKSVLMYSNTTNS